VERINSRETGLVGKGGQPFAHPFFGFILTDDGFSDLLIRGEHRQIVEPDGEVRASHGSLPNDFNAAGTNPTGLKLVFLKGDRAMPDPRKSNPDPDVPPIPGRERKPIDEPDPDRLPDEEPNPNPDEGKKPPVQGTANPPRPIPDPQPPMPPGPMPDPGDPAPIPTR